jgi:hypothetical protein
MTCQPPIPDDDDPYGIANVSGFYGPGAWSGWMLAMLASFIRIYTKPHARIDPNTWLFVLGTNWAAVDVLRLLPDIRRREAEVEAGGEATCQRAVVRP